MQGRGGEMMMEPEGTGALAAASDMVEPGCAEVLECPVLAILNLKGSLVAWKDPDQLEGISS